MLPRVVEPRSDLYMIPHSCKAACVIFYHTAKQVNSTTFVDAFLSDQKKIARYIAHTFASRLTCKDGKGCFKICLTLSFDHIFVNNNHHNISYTFL